MRVSEATAREQTTSHRYSIHGGGVSVVNRGPRTQDRMGPRAPQLPREDLHGSRIRHFSRGLEGIPSRTQPLARSAISTTEGTIVKLAIPATSGYSDQGTSTKADQLVQRLFVETGYLSTN